MKPTKLKADFRRKKIPDLLVLAETVLAAYPNHPAVQGTRPDFLPSDEVLKQSIESLRGSYTAALKGDRDKMKLRENDHDILIGHLTTLAHYYETAAGQNPQLLANTGFTQAPAGRSTYRSLGITAQTWSQSWHHHRQGGPGTECTQLRVAFH